MTDDQVIAKVRAAAMDVVDIYVPTRGDNIEIVCARAALAMVEQWTHHHAEAERAGIHSVVPGVGSLRAVYEQKQAHHKDAASRIMAALRKAVGE